MSIRRELMWNAIEKERNPVEACYNFVLQTLKLNASTVNDEWVSATMKKVSTFVHACKTKFKAVGRHRTRFRTVNSDWLAVTENFPQMTTKVQGKRPSSGRPETKFEDLSERGKRARTEKVREETSTSELTYAAQMSLRKAGKPDAAIIVKNTIEASPNTVRVFLNFVKQKEKGSEVKGLRSYTLPEALAYQYQMRIGKGGYIFNCRDLGAHNAKIFPSYEKLTKYRQDNCYPSQIKVSETKAAVPLQALLDHTVKRIALSVNDVVMVVPTESLGNVTLICKIGFDASSSHSIYNQVWQNEPAKDDTILLTSIVPLILVCINNTGKETILWINQRTSSTVFCRPLELEFTKETIPKIKEHSKFLERAMEQLVPTEIQVGAINIKCSHKVYMTMVDGKISSACTDTASQTCNVCKATPKLMNDIARLKVRECDTSAYKYGLSVLHANIRFLEYMLNLMERLDVKKGYVRYTAEEKQAMKTRRNAVLKRIKNETGLNLDQPSSAGGNTNTGNNSRRFFENPARMSGITGLDLDVLKRCGVILRTLSCGYSIDPEKFDTYARETAELLVDRYPWYYIPVAVHTVLIHGADYMRYFPLPLGMLSEEALESRHKDLRYLRLHHARKFSREANMHDMFYGLMGRSDPIVASLRSRPKPKSRLDQEVLALLVTPDEGTQISLRLEAILEDDSDIEDDVDSIL